MKAMILAAGVDMPNSHLSPLTLFMPKPMAPLANKPVMEYTVELLAHHGIKEIFASLHTLPHHIESHFGDGRRWGVRITYSLERQVLGTAGAVRRMASHFDDTFLVLRGDMLTDLDLEAALAFHRERGAQATIVLQPADSAGAVPMDGAGRILDLPGPGPVGAGVYILEPSILDHIPPGETYDLEQLFPQLAAVGAPLYGYRADHYWNDLANFGAYRQAHNAILRGQVRNALIPGRQVAEGVWLGHNVTIHPRAQLVPPVIVGDNSQVRADAIIGPETVLGCNVIVAEGATAAGSAILDNTYIGRLINVQVSVVNRNCLVNIPTETSVFITDRFLLGEVGQEALARELRRAVEWASTLMLLLLSAPLWLLAALLAWWGGSGPLLEKKPCATADPNAVGLEPRWRTIHLNSFRANPSTWAGRLLQQLGLVKLPGLLHVLRGEMSLVGVGPLTPKQAEGLTEDWQRQRFLHPAGLTGLWYINKNGKLPLEEQLIVDSYYAVTRTWREDLRILWQTPGAWWQSSRLKETDGKLNRTHRQDDRSQSLRAF